MVCLKIDGWALRLTILLQLAVWSTVGIVLLLKGIGTLQGRTLTSADRSVEKTSSSMGNSTAEYTAVSSMKHAEDGRGDLAVEAIPGQSSINKSAMITARINTELSMRNDRDPVGSTVTTENTSKDTPDIASKEPPSSALSSSRSSEVSDRSPEINEDTNDEALDGKIPTNLCAEGGHVGCPQESTSRPKEEWKIGTRRDESLDPARKESSSRRFTSEEASTRTSPSTWKEIDRTDDTAFVLSRESENERELPRSGVTGAIVMITIGSIMLSVIPIMIVLRLLYDRRQARKSIVELSIVSRGHTPPPSYEQVLVLMGEAPRYSTLVLNDRADDDYGRSSSPSLPSLSAPPSPTLSSSPVPNKKLLRRTFSSK